MTCSTTLRASWPLSAGASKRIGRKRITDLFIAAFTMAEFPCSLVQLSTFNLQLSTFNSLKHPNVGKSSDRRIWMGLKLHCDSLLASRERFWNRILIIEEFSGMDFQSLGRDLFSVDQDIECLKTAALA